MIGFLIGFGVASTIATIALVRYDSTLDEKWIWIGGNIPLLIYSGFVVGMRWLLKKFHKGA